MSRRPETITSVGIDVGTTTTQVVVSRLRVSSPSHDGAAAPEIRERTVVHRSDVHSTPLVDPETVDVDAVARIVAEEFAAAGIDPADVDTGAVIVTGETATRRNAEPLVHRIASDAGDFVAAAAGGSLEAVLAGRGSGAAAHALEAGMTVANVDVGGGTTNVAVFDPDGVVDTRCLDVGARLIRVDDGTVVHVSDVARRIAADRGFDLGIGDEATPDRLRPLATVSADLIADLLDGPPFDPLTEALAIGPLPSTSVAIDAVVVTGGVGRLLNDATSDRDTPSDPNVPADPSDPNVPADPLDPFEFGDLGPLLAAALDERLANRRLLTLAEDLRATVVGVGTESTTFSGRTVRLDESLLPLRDLPVVSTGPLGEDPHSPMERAVEVATNLYDLTDVSGIVLHVESVGELSYDRLGTVADAAAGAIERLGVPVVVVTEQNCANVLGQLIAARTDEAFLAIDELRLSEGVRLDVGEPFPGRDAVPVVVKTLAFGA